MEVDFHGWLPDDAVNHFHIMVGEARQSGEKKSIRFITGNGKIKQLIKKECADMGISCTEQFGNSGTLIANVD